MECPNCGAQVVGTVCEYCGTILKGADPQVVVVNNYYGSDAPQGQAGASQWTGHKNAGYTPAPSVTPQASAAQQAAYANVSPKSRTATVILALFFGCIGAHRFYTGRVGLGILYLFTCGLFCFGWIIDVVLALLGELKDRQGRPITRW